MRAPRLRHSLSHACKSLTLAFRACSPTCCHAARLRHAAFALAGPCIQVSHSGLPSMLTSMLPRVADMLPLPSLSLVRNTPHLASRTVMLTASLPDLGNTLSGGQSSCHGNTKRKATSRASPRGPHAYLKTVGEGQNGWQSVVCERRTRVAIHCIGFPYRGSPNLTLRHGYRHMRSARGAFSSNKVVISCIFILHRRDVVKCAHRDAVNEIHNVSRQNFAQLIGRGGNPWHFDSVGRRGSERVGPWVVVKISLIL